MENIKSWLHEEQKGLETRLEAYKDKDAHDLFNVENKALLEGRLLQISETLKRLDNENSETDHNNVIIK